MFNMWPARGMTSARAPGILSARSRAIARKSGMSLSPVSTKGGMHDRFEALRSWGVHPLGHSIVEPMPARVISDDLGESFRHLRLFPGRGEEGVREPQMSRGPDSLPLSRFFDPVPALGPIPAPLEPIQGGVHENDSVDEARMFQGEIDRQAASRREADQVDLGDLEIGEEATQVLAR